MPAKDVAVCRVIGKHASRHQVATGSNLHSGSCRPHLHTTSTGPQEAGRHAQAHDGAEKGGRCCGGRLVTQGSSRSRFQASGFDASCTWAREPPPTAALQPRQPRRLAACPRIDPMCWPSGGPTGRAERMKDRAVFERDVAGSATAFLLLGEVQSTAYMRPSPLAGALRYLPRPQKPWARAHSGGHPPSVDRPVTVAARPTRSSLNAEILMRCARTLQ